MFSVTFFKYKKGQGWEKIKLKQDLKHKWHYKKNREQILKYLHTSIIHTANGCETQRSIVSSQGRKLWYIHTIEYSLVMKKEPGNYKHAIIPVYGV